MATAHGEHLSMDIIINHAHMRTLRNTELLKISPHPPNSPELHSWCPKLFILTNYLSSAFLLYLFKEHREAYLILPTIPVKYVSLRESNWSKVIQCNLWQNEDLNVSFTDPSLACIKVWLFKTL